MAIPSKGTTHLGEGSRRQQPGDGGARRHLLLDGAIPAAGGRAAAMPGTVRVPALAGKSSQLQHALHTALRLGHATLGGTQHMLRGAQQAHQLPTVKSSREGSARPSPSSSCASRPNAPPRPSDTTQVGTTPVISLHRAKTDAPGRRVATLIRHQAGWRSCPPHFCRMAAGLPTGLLVLQGRAKSSDG